MNELMSDDSEGSSPNDKKRGILRRPRILSSSDEESDNILKENVNMESAAFVGKELFQVVRSTHEVGTEVSLNECAINPESRKDNKKNGKSALRLYFKSNLITDSDIESDDSEEIVTNVKDSEHRDGCEDKLNEPIKKCGSDENSKNREPYVEQSLLRCKLTNSSDIESDNGEEMNHSKNNEQPRRYGDGSDDKAVENYEVFKSGSEDGKQKHEEKGRRKKMKTAKVDQKLAIRSETQRMVREAAATLPYHRPKQRGLREFLSRKKQVIPIDSLRSNSSKMVDTWTVLNENIKEAIEFFKSESEDEGQEAGFCYTYQQSDDEQEEEVKQSIKKLDENDEQLTANNNNEGLLSVVSNDVLEVFCGDRAVNAETIGSFPVLNSPIKSMNGEIKDESVLSPKRMEIPSLQEKNLSTIVASDKNAENYNLGVQNNVTDLRENGLKTNMEVPSSGVNLNLLDSEDKASLNPTKSSEKQVSPETVGIAEEFKIIEDEKFSSSKNLNEVKENDDLPLFAPKNREKTPSGADKAAKWLEDIVSYETDERVKQVEAVKQKAKKLLLSPSVLQRVPTLSKSRDDFIDLDSPKKSSLHPGAMKLIDRIFKNQPVKLREKIEVTTSTALRNDNGEITKLEVETIVLSSDFQSSLIEGSHPRGKLQKLRESLKNKIEGRWEEEFKQRCAEFDLHKKDGFEDTVDDDGELDEEEIEEEMTSESEPEEDDVPLDDKPRKSCAFGDSEAEESDGEEGDDELDEDEDQADAAVDVDGNGSLAGEDEGDVAVPCDEEQETSQQQTTGDDLDDCTLPPYQPGGVMRNGDATPTQRTQQISSFSPTLSLTGLTPKIQHTPSSEPRRNISQTPVAVTSALKTTLSMRKSHPSETPSVMKNLFGKDSPLTKPLFESTDADDPFMFVSGAFPDASALPESQQRPKPRRILLQDESEDSCEPDLLDEVPTGEETPVKIHNMEGAECEKAAIDNLLSPEKSPLAQDILSVKKKRKKLTFSDDDDSEKEEEASISNNDEVSETAEAIGNFSEGEEEANSSDNEGGPLEYDSEENEIAPVKPSEFFENEAELSESEWSGDEDEQGLDKMDAEAGDADQLDDEQVASQLGRIHMRRLLDEDARDVRLLQELLFEDGDLHSDGKGRDRKFRWKNLTGFDRDDVLRLEGSDSDGEIDQEEAKLAKLRHEKAQLLLQFEKEDKEGVFEENFGKTSVLQLGRQLLKKIQSQPVLKPAGVMHPRGSFLTKDTAFLSNVAKAAGSTKNAPLGPSHSRNFVFAAKSPTKEKKSPEEAVAKSMKRKSLSCQETAKRAKLTPQLGRAVSLLDQLHS